MSCDKPSPTKLKTMIVSNSAPTPQRFLSGLVEGVCESMRNFAAKLVKIGDIALGEFPLLLAPMEDVSDPPFRDVCKQHGADLMYTEFISSEGLIRDAVKSRQKLDIFDYERPIGIQIFGGDEEAMGLRRGLWMPRSLICWTLILVVRCRRWFARARVLGC